jgi:DNA-binding LytR/AlgR family response regulator
MEEKLPESKFARVHKSFIVALEKITGIYTEHIAIGETELPIGRVYKNEFLKKAYLVGRF